MKILSTSCCLLLLVAINASAELCPSISAVQHNQLGLWHVFNANSGEPLSPERLQQYEHDVHHFAEAAYYDDAPEGAAQCYYDGENEHYHLEAYLARSDLQPDLRKGKWQLRWGNSYSCQQSLADCHFAALTQ